MVLAIFTLCEVKVTHGKGGLRRAGRVGLKSDIVSKKTKRESSPAAKEGNEGEKKRRREEEEDIEGLENGKLCSKDEI